MIIVVSISILQTDQVVTANAVSTSIIIDKYILEVCTIMWHYLNLVLYNNVYVLCCLNILLKKYLTVYEVF